MHARSSALSTPNFSPSLVTHTMVLINSHLLHLLALVRWTILADGLEYEPTANIHGRGEPANAANGVPAPAIAVPAALYHWLQQGQGRTVNQAAEQAGQLAQWEWKVSGDLRQLGDEALARGRS